MNTLTSLWEAAGKFSSLLLQEIHGTIITYHKSFMLYYTPALLMNLMCQRVLIIFYNSRSDGTLVLAVIQITGLS